MQILDNIYSNEGPLYPIEEFCPVEKALYIDIETTGLSKDTTSLYLIGCGYYENGSFLTKLFFADSESEELLILQKYLDFSSRFTHLFHFNGCKFDIPYLSYKAQKYGLGDIFESFTQVDVYQLLKPLRFLLFPASMRQKCIEDFMQITRLDKFNGGELINVYHSYVKTRNPDDFMPLITHNQEDVLGMHKIMPILSFLKLKNCSLKYISHTINCYNDYNGCAKKEIIIKYISDLELPKSFSSKTETMYLKYDHINGYFTFRLPVYSCEMKMFFDNYKDYYYLYERDECIHKNFAMGLDKKTYKKASKELCYTRHTGDFIKQPEKLFSPAFKTAYKDKAIYFKYPDSFTESEYDAFGRKLLDVFFNIKKNVKAAANT